MTKTRANGAPQPKGAATRRSTPTSPPPAELVKAAATPALGVGAGTGAEWALDAGRPKEILERLLDRPDAARLVRQTPVQPLYLFIRSLGLADARELLALCTPEQVQAFLDLDGWERDHVQPRRLFVWLQALRELGHERSTAHLRRLDPELLTTLIGPRVRVYELNDEDHPPPEEAEGLLYTTPDRMFLLDIVGAPPADADGDADGDGRREYGFGFDAGPVSFDYKTENPIGDLLTMPLMGTNVLMNGLGLGRYAPGSMVQRGVEGAWDWATNGGPGRAMSAVGNGLSTVGRGIGNAASAVGSGIVNGASAVGRGIGSAASAVGSGIANGASAVGRGARAAWNAVTGW